METQNNYTGNSGTFSLFEILIHIRTWITHLFSNWLILLFCIVIGGSIGVTYSFFKPITYVARLNFLVEEGKSGGGGGLAAIAGQFGFDLGGMGGGNGVLSGDNVLIFLKSKSLIKQALLSPYDSIGSISLADKYAEINNLKTKWQKSKKVSKYVSFPLTFDVKSYTRLQDSLLKVIIEEIVRNDLIVEKPDKKAAFVQVSVETRDELLSKFLCERLVKVAIDRYIFNKTSRQAINVGRLQKRADSIGFLLNRKTFASATAQEQLLDVNPAFKTLAASAEVVGRDKMMLTTIYGEVIKNLEISKVALSQETPTIQIIDDIMLPLKINRIEYVIAFLVGSLVALFLGIIFISGKYFFKNIANT
jgi:hypothetical protein